MSCTLENLAACFTLANLYVDGGMLYQDRLEVEFTERNRGINSLALRARWYPFRR